MIMRALLQLRADDSQLSAVVVTVCVEAGFFRLCRRSWAACVLALPPI